jgi:hypothetical protein
MKITTYKDNYSPPHTSNTMHCVLRMVHQAT